jgi:hypothetical protein
MHSVEMKNESVNKNFSIGHPFGINQLSGHIMILAIDITSPFYNSRFNQCMSFSQHLINSSTKRS